MLRLSMHAGPLRSISRFNRLDWLDIGYQRLDAHADYKVVLFKIGQGATAPVKLPNYPRWSASLWDLTSRALARTLFPEEAPATAFDEAVPAAVQVKRKRAFAECVSAVIQHIPNSGVGVRRVAALQIEEHKSKRCQYTARMEEDLRKPKSIEAFLFAPSFLRPAELVLRTALFALSGDINVVPPRPALLLPKDKLIDGKRYLAIHQLKEPARTGLLRWLYENHEPPVPNASAPEGLVSWETFDQFLKKAV